MAHRSLRLFALFILVLLSSMSQIQYARAAGTTFYVAPDGNDAYDGRRSSVHAAKKTGPVATFQRAKQLVAEQKRRNAASGRNLPIRVLFRGGVYRLNSPIVLTPGDSGTRGATITYAAFSDEKPVFRGAIEVDTRFNSWKKEPAGPIWQIQLDKRAAAAIKKYRSLFIDGKRATVARSPNALECFTPTGPEKPLDGKTARGDRTTMLSIRYADGDVKKSDFPEGVIDDAIVYYYHAWTASMHRIQRIEEDEKILRFKNPSRYPMFWWREKERFFIENFPAALDAPGEWYFDPGTRVLRYYPLPGQDMARAKTEIPCVQEILVLQGDVKQKRYVRYLNFQGLAFEQTGWTMPDEGMVDGQAAAFLEEAAVRAVGARNCRFVKCRIAHTGGYAFWFRDGCKNNTFTHGEMTDLGAGGIRFGETGRCGNNDPPKEPEKLAERNEILHSRIYDGGHVYPTGVGILIGKSSYNRVAHCAIHDLFYTGVSVGWTWGYAPSSAHHNRIEFNHIHHIGKRQLTDMGGIYFLGKAPGTVARNNLIHDIQSYYYGGWGLYTDQGSTDVVMENNVVYNVTDGAFHQNYGENNLLRNNILAFAETEAQVRWTRIEEHISFILEGNIVYGEKMPPLHGNPGIKFQADQNLYWNRVPDTLKFPGEVDFATWQKDSGQDAYSKVADPKFKDPTHGDFSLPADSPAWDIDFKPIDLSRVGPQD